MLDQVVHGWTIRQWAELQPDLAYNLTRAFANVWLRASWRMRWYGAELITLDGPTLAVPNHSSWLDGWIQALGHRRMPRFMGKRELIDSPLLGRYMRSGGVFPVDRGASDAAAIDIAKVLLQTGQHLVVYPEGTRIRDGVDGGLGQPRRGAARLALATGVPVQPIATYGLKPGAGRRHLPLGLRHLPLARRVTTIYGEPFVIPAEESPSRERLDEVRDEIWQRVDDLFSLAREVSMEATPPKELTLPTGRVVRSGIAPG